MKSIFLTLSSILSLSILSPAIAASLPSTVVDLSFNTSTQSPITVTTRFIEEQDKKKCKGYVFEKCVRNESGLVTFLETIEKRDHETRTTFKMIHLERQSEWSFTPTPYATITASVRKNYVEFNIWFPTAQPFFQG
jgi:hypothetical protein